MRVLLKEFRLRRGWTQKELSEKSGVPQPMISEIESEVSRYPQINTLYKLSQALKCTVDDLIDDETA